MDNIYQHKMKVQRQIDAQLLAHFSKYQQAVIVLGARQVGKTTLLKRLFPEAKTHVVTLSNIY